MDPPPSLSPAVGFEKHARVLGDTTFKEEDVDADYIQVNPAIKVLLQKQRKTPMKDILNATRVQQFGKNIQGTNKTTLQPVQSNPVDEFTDIVISFDPYQSNEGNLTKQSEEKLVKAPVPLAAKPDGLELPKRSRADLFLSIGNDGINSLYRDTSTNVISPKNQKLGKTKYDYEAVRSVIVDGDLTEKKMEEENVIETLKKLATKEEQKSPMEMFKEFYNKRDSTEIPRAIYLDMVEEVLPIIQKMLDTYRREEGEKCDDTRQSLAHVMKLSQLVHSEGHNNNTAPTASPTNEVKEKENVTINKNAGGPEVAGSKNVQEGISIVVEDTGNIGQ